MKTSLRIVTRKKKKKKKKKAICGTLKEVKNVQLNPLKVKIFQMKKRKEEMMIINTKVVVKKKRTSMMMTIMFSTLKKSKMSQALKTYNNRFFRIKIAIRISKVLPIIYHNQIKI